MKTVGVFLLATLAAGTLPAQQGGVVTAKTVAEFGGAQDNLDDELSAVQDVLRKPDGSFVVSNGRPLEVRYYSAEGDLIRRIGKMGDGPGEYRYTAYLQEWPGDSVLVFSSGGSRWILFGLNGEMAREWPANQQEPRPVRSWRFAGNAILRIGTIGSAGCPTDAIRRVVPRDSEVPSYAFVDGGSRIWMRRADSEGWTIYNSAGIPLVHTELPRDFKITHFSGNHVTGVTADEDGFPFVTSMSVELSAATKAGTAPCSFSSGSVSNVRAAQLKTAMRNSMTFAEAYYADHSSYPKSGRDLPSNFIPSDAEFSVLEASSTGYVFMITDRLTQYRCIVAVGGGEEGMLPDGAMICGD